MLTIFCLSATVRTATYQKFLITVSMLVYVFMSSPSSIGLARLVDLLTLPLPLSSIHMLLVIVLNIFTFVMWVSLVSIISPHYRVWPVA